MKTVRAITYLRMTTVLGLMLYARDHINGWYTALERLLTILRLMQYV